jgi:hypothetical protein
VIVEKRKPFSESPLPDEKSSKLRPGRARRQKDVDHIRVTAAVTRLLRAARQVSSALGPKANGSSGPTRMRSGRRANISRKRPQKAAFTKTYQQRGTATVRYMKRGAGKSAGGWRRHGSYLERDGAAGKEGPRPGDRVGLAKDQDLGETAESWEQAGDPRMWKIVISPEHGENVDFDALAESVIENLEKDTGSNFEWGGIVHRNTDHPHMHLIVRGVRDNGEPLLLTKKQVQQDVRKYVREELTRQLGPRSAAEVADQRLRETTLDRPTGLDRDLEKRLSPGVERGFVQPKSPLEQKRLEHLEKLGLAKREVSGAGNLAEERTRWTVDRDFVSQLRNMQNVRERARALFRDGVALSDHALPIEIASRSRKLAGRVLLNSEEEGTGLMQTAVETLDGKVVFLRHDAALRNAWNRGDLKPGNLILIDELKSAPGRLYVASLGAGGEVLKNKELLRAAIERLEKSGLMPEQSPTEEGWLGKFFKRRDLERTRQRGMGL